MKWYLFISFWKRDHCHWLQTGNIMLPSSPSGCTSVMLDQNHSTSQWQMLKQIMHSHCCQPAFALLHLLIKKSDWIVRMVQHATSVVCCNWTWLTVQAVQYSNNASLTPNGTYAHPVCPSVDNLDKLWCGRNNHWACISWIMESINKWRVPLSRALFGQHIFPSHLANRCASVCCPCYLCII